MNIFDFRCKYCGGDLEAVEGMKSVGKCIYCGSKQTVPKLESEKRANLFERANHLRRNNEFDKAEALYEQLLNEDLTDPEAYWSLVLCKYGIEYVEDNRTKARIPTINRMQYTSILADENYKSAIANATPDQKELYEAEAITINEIQKGILEIANKEEPFDIFICYKETDASGKRSKESYLAHDLYHELTREGYKVFFARVTLQGKLGVAYEPYIFSALNSSKVMIVLGTQKEHFEAVWVRNEWSRFLGQIKNGEKKVLVPAYKDMDAYDLPVEFSHLQALDMSRFGFMHDLIDSINTILKIYKPKEVVVPPIYRPSPTSYAAENTQPTPEKKAEPISRPASTSYGTEKKTQPAPRPTSTSYGTEKKTQPTPAPKSSAPKSAATSSVSAKTASDKKKKSNKALIIILIACTVGIIGLLAIINNSGKSTPNNNPSGLTTTPATTVYDESGTGYEEDTSVNEQETVKEESVGLQYELNEDGDGYFVYRGTCTDANVVIPAKHNGIRVIGIGSNAFEDYESLESITISEGIIFIGDSAFSGCIGLTSITLPDSMANIGVAAFANCTNLKDVVIPDNVYKIDTYAFSSCTGLENIYFSGTRAEWNGVIFGYGWDQDTGNYTVHCSDDVPEPETTQEETTIVEETTPEETTVEETTVEEKTTVAETTAAEVTTEETTKVETTTVEETTVEETTPEETTVEETTVEETTEEVTTEAEKKPTAGLKYELEEDSYKVVYSANHSANTEIVIPATYYGFPVTSIGDYAFDTYVNLTSITIPDSITSIGEYAFYYCSSLTSIYFKGTKEQWDSITKGFGWDDSTGNYTVYYAKSEAVKESVGLEYTLNEDERAYFVAGIGTCTDTNVVIPATYNGLPVTSIGGEFAFHNCSSLTSITIPDSVTSIGNYTFFGCSNLTSITIPDSVTSIGICAFYGCSSLTSITIPDSVTSIGICAFYGCSSLTSITIPDSVTSIGEGAFCGCDALEMLTVDVDNPCYYSDGNCIIEKSTKTLIAGFNNSVIPNDVTSIGNHAFRDCSSLTSITIPNSVTSIGTEAFCLCKNLTSITIPNSVTSIENYTFYGCSSLTSITIPDSVTSIGERAFSNCSNLQKVYYGGKTASEWAKISIGALNESLTNATIYYYYPDNSGSSSIVIPGGPIDTSLRYWYYVDGVVTERPAGWPFVQSPV